MPLLVPTPTTSLLSGGSQSVGAATLRTLPAEQLLAEHARLEHSVAHLQRSNAELHASLAVQGEGTEEWSDEDRKELSGAVRENEETIQAQKDLMQRIRDVMHEKGGSHAGIAGYE
ncbi:hypothetical protein FA09DRAFT_359162 [Tilletiopsis washingtonensis]|uniref:Uncharacterized protein n=1 Tax=Tilletiopsis washingtonensis TaxID=58919 RepID=A0A316ZFG0_9BASI|nr:hypothetical protein FA09DRAFT_359162 [Tilletiopsis washingtonensis]PWN99758.1 hypothetical protein FA09DRAFT_359162 [Tilletiopsis washingtonensis]